MLDSKKTLSLERLIWLSDAIFCVGLTLLIADLILALPILNQISSVAILPQVTDFPDQVIVGWLRDNIPVFAAHASGFIALAYLWRRHHELLRRFERISRPIFILNAIFLGIIATLSYPAALLARSEFSALASSVFLGFVASAFVVLGLIFIVGQSTRRMESAYRDHNRFLATFIWVPCVEVTVAGTLAAINAWLSSSILTGLTVAAVASVFTCGLIQRRLNSGIPHERDSDIDIVDQDLIIVEKPDRTFALTEFFSSALPERLLVFSDGVYGIAITFMALILLPERASLKSNTVLLEQLGFAFKPAFNVGNFFFFALLFAVLMIVWSMHVRVFRFVRTIDSQTFWLNMFHLFVVVWTPFIFGMMGDVPTEAHLPWLLSTVFIYTICFSMLLLLWSELRHQLRTSSDAHATWRLIISEVVFLCIISLIILYPLGLGIYAGALIVLKDVAINASWVDSKTSRKRSLRHIISDDPDNALGSTVDCRGPIFMCVLLLVGLALSVLFQTEGVQKMPLVFW